MKATMQPSACQPFLTRTVIRITRASRVPCTARTVMPRENFERARMAFAGAGAAAAAALLLQCVPALAATEQYTESSSYASELEAIVAKRKLNLPTIESSATASTDPAIPSKLVEPVAKTKLEASSIVPSEVKSPESAASIPVPKFSPAATTPKPQQTAAANQPAIAAPAAAGKAAPVSPAAILGGVVFVGAAALFTKSNDTESEDSASTNGATLVQSSNGDGGSSEVSIPQEPAPAAEGGAKEAADWISAWRKRTSA